MKDRTMEIFALMEHGRGIHKWQQRFEAGQVVDSTPYSYHLARQGGHSVFFSSDSKESTMSSFVRRGAQKILGFDVSHVMNNRHDFRRCDIVWTHTEQIHLAYTALRIFFRSWPPALCNSIWIADEYKERNIIVRAIWKFLLGRSSLNISESQGNVDFISRLTRRPTLLVRFGLDAKPYSLDRSSPNEILHVLAIGNDRHRDWRLLSEIAVKAGKDVAFRLVTRLSKSDLPVFPKNVTVMAASSVSEIRNSYDWADVVAIPLSENRHASGVTVAMEANAANRPVLVNRVGGIDDYFPLLAEHMLASDANSDDWLSALLDVSKSIEQRSTMSDALARDVVDNDLTATGYVSRLIEASMNVVSGEFSRVMGSRQNGRPNEPKY